MFRKALDKTSLFSKSAKKTEEQIFEYAELPDPSAYIRLVEVLPAQSMKSPSSEEKIRCKISHVSLLDKPVYQALSYTWGEDAASYNILLNGSHFQMTENLYWFLYYHSRGSDAKKKTLLWIDAICIDQKNIVEKGHQVQKMGALYQGAELVIIWLGRPRTDLVDRALQFLNYAEQHFGDTSIAESYENLLGDDGLRLIIALEGLFNLPYWFRTWIV